MQSQREGGAAERSTALGPAYDVVVIGSGFGGASVACRLAQAGRSVAVLERGKRWEGHQFPRSIGEVGDAFWSEGRAHGFLEYLAFRKVDVVQGAGVGGGSLHYFNVNVKAPDAIFERGQWPAQVRARSLAPYYDIALDMLESATFRIPVGREALPLRTQVFIDAARRSSLAVEAVPIAVYTDADRTHRFDGKVQSACTYCGNCLFGCDVGAKNTLDRNYLAVAERHGAEVHALHVVDAIAERAGGGYEVRYRRLDDDPRRRSTAGVVQAATVVVAAGALGSTRLLLRSRDVEHTLPRLGPAVGRRFSLNGEFLFAAARETVDRVDPGRGPPITAMVVAERNGHIVTVEDLGLPDSLLWFLEGALPPGRTRLRSLLRLASVYARRTVGVGARGSRLKLEMDALVAGGRTPRTLPYLGMGTDSADGVVTLRDDEIDVAWRPHRNRSLYREIEKLMAEVTTSAGGRFATSFLWRWPMRKVLTAHPLGGCVMGDDPRTSVVDHRGQVWGHPGLYVVDGSIMPAALAVNPSLTITALGERAAFWMTQEREMTPADRAAPVNA